MGAKILTFLFGNGRTNNKKFTLGAGTDMTLHFKESGNDTDDDKYYDLRKASTKVSLILTAIGTITKVNNTTMDSPITLGIGENKFTEGIEWTTITVRADAANNYEVLAY